MGKSRKKEKSGKKWKSIKVDEDTYLMLKNLSAFLNIKIGKVVTITTLFFYALLQRRADIAYKIIWKLIQRYEKKKRAARTTRENTRRAPQEPILNYFKRIYQEVLRDRCDFLERIQC